MPNWCSNDLIITGKNLERLQELSDALVKGDLLKTLVPIPGPLQMATAPNDDEEQAALLTEQYGYPDWFSFCLSRWGTKWDPTDASVTEIETEGEDHTLSASFESAWSPPIDALSVLVEEGFKVVLHYYEPGMGFTGTWTGDPENGVDDDYYDIPGSSDAVEDVIPSHLNERFAISETMSQYEEDDE